MNTPDACPFCGKDDTFVERTDYSSCHVVCNDCGARGPVCCDENDADAAATENNDAEPGEMAARRAWKRRPRIAVIESAIRIGIFTTCIERGMSDDAAIAIVKGTMAQLCVAAALAKGKEQ
jgi:hypothetical protein